MGDTVMEEKNGMISFAPIVAEDKEKYEICLATEEVRGCEFSFANLYLWGRQSIAFLHGQALLFSQFNRRSVYPYPVGQGDKKAAVDAIIADAHARGIPCRITGLLPDARKTLEGLYPGKFHFHADEGSFDYVYDINDLAELTGKKYHGKRNHLNRFNEAYPNHSVEPLSVNNLPSVKAMLKNWYDTRLEEDPNGDYLMEQVALARAFRDYEALGLEGLVLLDGERVLGFTIASRLSHDTFDVHFEKALAQVQGAYPAINCALACYIREKYPEVKYLDREEDMGIEGLRRAKKSYHPHHMVEKCWACLLEDGYDY